MTEQKIAIILEESEAPGGDRIASIRTVRGEEVMFNVDKAVCGLADLFSELDQELREGWTLNGSWFEDALHRLRLASRHDMTALEE